MKRSHNVGKSILLMAAVLVFAAESAMAVSVNEAPPALTVHGHGEVAAVPDLAVVRLGASVQTSEADRAQQQVNQIMQRTLKALRALGMAEKDLQTVGLALNPVYSKPERVKTTEVEGPHIVGYRASNTIQIRLEDLSRVGEVIDAGIRSGANNLQGVSFDIRDGRRYRIQALQMAAQDAMEKAGAIAGAMGLRLGDVLEVQEGGVSLVRPSAVNRVYAGDAAEATPIQPGQMQISADVQVRYRLLKP